ncbi:hypothetical protein AB6A40_006339 [Gnathostoma spinigerum]|uniref:Torsin-1A C-terminal domain-containing protein n=1 Tax=Gnathostoma spinigerum TaxID=75299 RepID=A0ABD6EJA2_9BILA
MKSEYVHLYVSTLHFSDPRRIAEYQSQLRDWIHGNVSLCEKSLFIFDEVDKMPSSVMNAIKPFIDHYDSLEGVDYRHSIFIFLSNLGSSDIAQKALEYYEAGKKRESIKLEEVEELLMAGAFNEEGGLRMSDLISNHLVDHFIPFLPLERRHILLCIQDYAQEMKIYLSEGDVEAIAELLQYFPRHNPIYSSSGCKRVAHKTALYVSTKIDNERQLLEHDLSDEL